MNDEATFSQKSRPLRRGLGRIFRRGEIYWIAYFLRGREYRESARSRREGDATKLLKKRLGEIASRRFVGPSEEKITFDDLAKGFLLDYELRGLHSLRAAKARVAHLKEHFGNFRALDVTTTRIRDYQANRRAEKASPATVNRETTSLARMFRIAVKSGRLTTLPIFPDKLEEATPRQGFFERHEYLAIRGHLASDYADMFDFSYYSGWRRGEVRTLTWAEVDLAAGAIRLSPARSKNKSGRILPLSAPMLQVLQRRLAVRRLDCVLVFHRKGESIVDWRKAWANACKTAGLPGKLLHDCRRTAARNLVRAGVPEHVARQLTGHKTRSVFDRYNIIVEDDLQSGVEKLAAYVDQQPTDPKVIALKKVAS